MKTAVFGNFLSNYFNYYSGLNRATWQMIFLKFIISILISIYYFLPIYFVHKLNISIDISGFLISLYGAGTIFGGKVGGKMSDKIPPFLICIVSLMLIGMAFIGLLFITSPFLLALILFLMGVATYSLITAIYILTLFTCQNNELLRIKAINILEATANLGLGLAALLIAALGIENILYIFLSAGLTVILLSIFMMLNYKILPLIALPKNAVSTTDEFSRNNIHSKIIIRLILISVFIAGMIISQLSSTYSIYLHTMFSSNNFGIFGMAFALNTFLVVFFQTPLSSVCCKYNYILVSGMGVFLLGLGMFFLVFAYSFVFVLLACVVYTLGEMIFFSVAQLICYENAAPDKKGEILGIYRMVYAASRVAGPASGSYIYYQFGSKYLWCSCGILGMLCYLKTIIFTKNLNLSN